MLPGSHVVKDPKMRRISREEWVGKWLWVDFSFMILSGNMSSTYFILPRAISMAFCRLGSPVGSILCLSAMDLSTSCGFPACHGE